MGHLLGSLGLQACRADRAGRRSLEHLPDLVPSATAALRAAAKGTELVSDQ